MTEPLRVPATLLGCQWARDGRGHVESWLAKIASPAGQRAFWVRSTLLERCSVAVSEVCAVAFDREAGHVVTRSVLPASDGRFGRGTIDVAVDGCELSLGHARGELATGRRRLRWDLAVGPERAAPVLHLPAALYGRGFPERKSLTAVADARAGGSVVVEGDGREDAWNVDGWPAMLAHDWARARGTEYAWGHCNVWDGAADLVVDGLTARVPMGPLLGPAVTFLFVRVGGESFDLALEGRRWTSYPAMIGRAVGDQSHGSTSLRRWEFGGKKAGFRIEGEFSAETDDFVALTDEAPSGAPATRLVSALARANLSITLPSGRAVHATSRAATLEIVTRDRHHGVRPT